MPNLVQFNSTQEKAVLGKKTLKPAGFEPESGSVSAWAWDYIRTKFTFRNYTTAKHKTKQEHSQYNQQSKWQTAKLLFQTI